MVCLAHLEHCPGWDRYGYQFFLMCVFLKIPFPLLLVENNTGQEGQKNEVK